MNDLSFRNIWIGFGVSMAIAIIGALLFHSAGQVPMSFVGFLGMAAGVVVLHVLDDRELRRKKDNSAASPAKASTSVSAAAERP